MDSSKYDPEQGASRHKRMPIKRVAVCEEEICLKKRKEDHQSLPDHESSQQLLKKSCHCCNPHISSGGDNPSRKDSTVTGASTSGLANDLIASRIPQQSEVIHKAGHSPGEMESNCKPDQPNSVDNSCVHLRKESSSRPGHALRDLFNESIDEYALFVNNWRIFYSNLPMDVLTEEETIFLDKESKLKKTISQTESLNIDQTLNKDEFQNHVDQGNKHCYDLENLDFWEDKQSETEGVVLFPPVSSTSINTNTYLYSQCPERGESNSVPFIPDISKTDIPWKSEDLFKDVEINFPKKNQMPPFPKVRIRLPDLLEKTDEFTDCNKDPLNAKDIFHSFAENFPGGNSNFTKRNPFVNIF
ncbi:uncharacterized protein LOC129956979 isoform X2 [Argiope bruennichi]|nr:uncharacterized protein LOC129956979 isoform X2 [Argiope bruennichi]